MTQRDWLVFEDAVRDLSVRPLFDTVVAQIDEGTARVEKIRGESIRGFAADGTMILGTAVLQYVISLVPADEFDYDRVWAFTNRMRVLLGWDDIDYTLTQWVKNRLCIPFFVNQGSDWNEEWARRGDADASHIPESYLRFACSVAIGQLKYGPSYASVSAERIFGWVTGLGSSLPSQLKKSGTGDLPAEFISFQTDSVKARANDALAVIRITISEETERAYAEAIDYLCRLLGSTDFPRSYAIEFRGPTKKYLPIPGLPKKGVHQLFACAAAYPALWTDIERYARAAMREFEWYTNVDDENPAMPGTFAVFAVGMATTEAAGLVVDYLHSTDGEHQEMQARFVEAYIDASGFTTESVAYLLACAANIQHLRHRPAYATVIASRSGLELLIAAKHASLGTEASSIGALRSALDGGDSTTYAWAHACYAIWGEAAERDSGAAVIASAPQHLRELYVEVFA